MGVLGLLVGLLTIAATFLLQWPAPVAELAPTDVLSMAVQSGDLPPSWSAVGGKRLPDRRVWLELSRADREDAPAFVPSEEEQQAVEALLAAGAGPQPAPGKGHQPSPWHALEEGPSAPAAGALLEVHPKGPMGVAARKRAFAGLRYKDIRSLSSKGEEALVNQGELPWGPYLVPWVHSRHYRWEDGLPTFHDSVRVDLTSSPAPVILRLVFPNRARGSHEELAAFLEALTPFDPVEPSSR